MFLSLCFSDFLDSPHFWKDLILLSKIPIADRSLYFVKPLQLIIPNGVMVHQLIQARLVTKWELPN